MPKHTCYMPLPLTGLSQKDWAYLCELAEENRTTPSRLASEILANEIGRFRDGIDYVEEAMKETEVVSNTSVLAPPYSERKHQ